MSDSPLSQGSAESQPEPTGDESAGVPAAPRAHDGEHHDHEVESLREVFRERRLSIGTMQPSLRAATGSALACMLGVALLILLRDAGGGWVVVGRTAGVVQQISTPLFIATLVLLSVGFAYVLTGAVLASWPIALITLVVVTAELGVYTGAFGHLFGQVGSGFMDLVPVGDRWVARALIAAIWVVAAVVVAVDRVRRPASLPRPARLSVLVIYAALFGAFLFDLRRVSPNVGGLDLYPEIVALIMSDIALLVTPILTIASVDFGEWGGLLGERAASGVRHGRRRLLTPLAVLLGTGLIVFGYLRMTTGSVFSGTRLWTVTRSTLILAASLVLVVLVGRILRLHRRRWPATLNFAGLFAVCGLIFYVVVPVAGAIAGVFDHVGAPIEAVTENGQFTSKADVLVQQGGLGPARYTLLVPRGWTETSLNGVSAWREPIADASGSKIKGMQQVEFLVLPIDVPITTAAAALHFHATGSVEHRGAWLVEPVASDRIDGLLWVRSVGTKSTPRTAIAETIVRGAPLERVRPLFEAIVGSYRTAGQPHAELPAGEGEASAKPATANASDAKSGSDGAQSSGDREQTWYLVVVAAFSALFLLLIGTVGRRWPARLVMSMLLFAFAGLMAFLYFANSVGRFVAHASWPFVGTFDLIAGVGVLSLVALVLRPADPARRQSLTTGLIGLQATVWALYGMSALYDHALAAGRVAIWAAVILLVAIAWDVVMSGESMTNRSSKNLPRPSRVLAFLGYVVLVAAAVMFFSGQRAVASATAVESFFEPEAVTQNGLFRLAFPLAVLLYLLRWARGSDQPVAAGAQSPVAAGPGASAEPDAADPDDDLPELAPSSGGPR